MGLSQVAHEAALFHSPSRAEYRDRDLTQRVLINSREAGSSVGNAIAGVLRHTTKKPSWCLWREVSIEIHLVSRPEDMTGPLDLVPDPRLVPAFHSPNPSTQLVQARCRTPTQNPYHGSAKQEVVQVNDILILDDVIDLSRTKARIALERLVIARGHVFCELFSSSPIAGEEGLHTLPAQARSRTDA